MSNDELARLFLSWSGANYGTIKAHMRGMFNKMKFDSRSNKEYFSEENYHTCLLNAYENISKRGFKFPNNNLSKSASSFMNYFFISLRNELYYSTEKAQRFNYEFDFDLLLVDEDEEEIRGERMREHVIIQSIYEHVILNYSPIEAAIFQHYYRTPYSYRKLSKINGYSVGYISEVINKIRDDIRIKFNYNLPGRKK